MSRNSQGGCSVRLGTCAPPCPPPCAPPYTPDCRARPARRRRLSDVLRVAGGLAALALSWSLAQRRPLHAAEIGANRTVNHLPEHGRVLWPVMQAGTLAAAPVAALAARAAGGPRALSVSLLAAGGSAWLLAKPIKTVAGRGRPASFMGDVRVREEASGLGFVSGHTAVATAMSTAANAYLPPTWRWVPRTIAAVVAVARIYYGAHLPLDVVGGAGLGVALGGVVNLAIGVPRQPERRS